MIIGKKPIFYYYDFERIINNHKMAPDYYQRTEILDVLKRYISDHDRGFITIEGGAGEGKSSIMAEAASHFSFNSNFPLTCIYHFNSLFYGVNQTTEFITTLYESLSDSFELDNFYYRYKEVKASQRRQAGFVSDIIHALTPDKLNGVPVLVIIDALDEIDDHDSIKNRNW